MNMLMIRGQEQIFSLPRGNIHGKPSFVVRVDYRIGLDA